MTFRQQAIRQMRSQKTRATGDNRNRFGFFLGHSTGYLIPKQQVGQSDFELQR
jgi:hypothetical protein